MALRCGRSALKWAPALGARCMSGAPMTVAHLEEAARLVRDPDQQKRLAALAAMKVEPARLPEEASPSETEVWYKEWVVESVMRRLGRRVCWRWIFRKEV